MLWMIFFDTLQKLSPVQSLRVSTMATTPAKTVTKGSGKTFKNILDLPFKMKWPVISSESASLILAEMRKLLEGMQLTAKKKQKKKQKKQDEEGDPVRAAASLEEKTATEDIEHLPKRLCLEVKDEPTAMQQGSVQQSAGTVDTTEACSTVPSRECSDAKRSQIVVGVNEVTKALERGFLRAVVVCLSAKPVLLHQHLQVLSATRNVPCVAMHGTSEVVAQALGLKRAMAIGLKKISATTTEDYFSSLANLIADLAPPLHVPWLQAKGNEKHSTQLATESQETAFSGTETKTKFGKNEGEKCLSIEMSSGSERKREQSKVSKAAPLTESDLKGQLVGLEPRGNLKQKRKRDTHFSRQMQRDVLAPPHVDYIPVNIKKTLISPKSRKK